MKNGILKRLSIMALLAISFTLTACGGNKTDNSSIQADSVVKEGTQTAEDLTIHLEGSNDGLPSPFKHTARGPGIGKMQLLYDSLLEKDENGVIPWLAKSWEISDDGTVFTFHLQENSLWHDGTPLTAKDVKFTFDYYKEHPPVTNYLLVNGKYIITDSKVLDDHTVQLTVNNFDNTYLTGIGYMRILPEHIWKDVTDPAAFTGEGVTIGSGPYMLDSYNATEGSYRYVPFKDYWGLKPAVKAIEWVPVSDSTLAFENNEIDLINATADIVTKYKNDDKYTVKTGPSFHSYRLMMNMEAVPELQDVNLRKAITYGINRQDLIDKIARGAADLSSIGYVPTYSSWYNKDIEKYDYNKEKATELLGGKTYNFKLLTDNSADGTKMAELIKLSLEEIGIKVTVESVESKTRDNAVNTGGYELLLINSGGLGGDPDYLRTIYGQGSKTIRGWSNDEFNQLATAQATEKDQEVRKQDVFKMQNIIAEEVPMVMIYGAVDNFVYRKEYYDGWTFRYDHSKIDQIKLSYLIRE